MLWSRCTHRRRASTARSATKASRSCGRWDFTSKYTTLNTRSTVRSARRAWEQNGRWETNTKIRSSMSQGWILSKDIKSLNTWSQVVPPWRFSMLMAGWVPAKKKISENIKSCLCITYTFTWSSNFQLKQHLMDHGGKRPYPCPECTFTCKTKQQLNEHRRKHSVSWKPVWYTHICPFQTFLAGRKGLLMSTVWYKVHIQKRSDQAHKTQSMSKENCSSNLEEKQESGWAVAKAICVTWRVAGSSGPKLAQIYANTAHAN